MPRQGNNPVMNENVGVRFSRLERAHLLRSSDPPHTGLGPQFSDRVAMPELRTRWTLPQPALHQRGPAAPICTCKTKSLDTRFKNIRAAESSLRPKISERLRAPRQRSRCKGHATRKGWSTAARCGNVALGTLRSPDRAAVLRLDMTARQSMAAMDL